jgi:hypothetical protein
MTTKRTKAPTLVQADAVPVTELAVAEPQAMALHLQQRQQSFIERLVDLASDQAVDVVKINALLDAQEKIMTIQRKAAFDRAFAAMQAELPVVVQGGIARVTKDGTVIRTTHYARNVDIVSLVRPVIARHGFSLRHKSEVIDGMLHVTGILTHAEGHSETDTFVCGRDDSGHKNAIQSWGSAREYGRRYTAKSLLWLVDKESDDDDGAATGEATGEVDAPRREERPHRAPAESDTRPLSKATTQPDGTKKQGQLERLYAIFRKSNRTREELKTWLKARYGYESSTEIQRRHYDEIVRLIQEPGPLPLREPGEEG